MIRETTEVDREVDRTEGALANQIEMRASLLSLDSPLHRAWQRFGRHRLAIFGATMLLLVALTALAAPWLAPYPYQQQNLERYREPPSSQHWLGTDSFGRDVLSRVLYGGRVSLSVGLLAVTMYELVALALGCAAGYYGGRVDAVIMRTVDAVMAFPTLMIILYLVSLIGPGIFTTMLAIALVGWAGPTRLVRGQILAAREMDFITAAHAIGAPNGRVIMRHILPVIIAPLLVHATFGIAHAILLEAALSFLNLGVQPPAASWGNMMTDAQKLTILERMPWLWVPPGVAIMLSVLSINFIGDGLRDALDPKATL